MANLLHFRSYTVEYRILWRFLAREGTRISEASGLRVGLEVELTRGVISLDKNKTDDARAWAMDPGVVAALRKWVETRLAKRGDLLFTDEYGRPFEKDKLAERLRLQLRKAGVDREELFVAGVNRGPLRVHDLRGTFVTLSLANGRTESWVQDRTGHTTSAMINRYRMAARSATELGLGPLAPICVALPELDSPRDCPVDTFRSEMLDTAGRVNYRNLHDKPKWRNWQTRRTQNPLLEITCRFKSDLRYRSHKRASIRVERLRTRHRDPAGLPARVQTCSPRPCRPSRPNLPCTLRTRCR